MMHLNSIQYTIGQVSELTDIPQSALRYWETVFDALDPEKSPGGNRKYSEEDIKIIYKIKELLYDRGFTIKGANLQLKETEFPERMETPVITEQESKNVPELLDKTIDEAIENVEKSDLDKDALKIIIRELKSILRLLEE